MVQAPAASARTAATEAVAIRRVRRRIRSTLPVGDGVGKTLQLLPV
jgi:hypothetical protein